MCIRIYLSSDSLSIFGGSRKAQCANPAHSYRIPGAWFCHWIYSAERRDNRTWDESGTQESCPMGRGVIGELVECPLYVCLILCQRCRARCACTDYRIESNDPYRQGAVKPAGRGRRCTYSTPTCVYFHCWISIAECIVSMDSSYKSNKIVVASCYNT